MKMYLQEVISKTIGEKIYFLLALRKRAASRSGSIIQWYGSGDQITG
jgi:hypothetical protein